MDAVSKESNNHDDQYEDMMAFDLNQPIKMEVIFEESDDEETRRLEQDIKQELRDEIIFKENILKLGNKKAEHAEQCTESNEDNIIAAGDLLAFPFEEIDDIIMLHRADSSTEANILDLTEEEKQDEEEDLISINTDVIAKNNSLPDEKERDFFDKQLQSKKSIMSEPAKNMPAISISSENSIEIAEDNNFSSNYPSTNNPLQTINTSVYRRMLKTVVENIFMILPALNKYILALRGSEAEIIPKKIFLDELKLYYFRLSYSTVVNLLLPNKNNPEFNKKFIKFLKKFADNKGVIISEYNLVVLCAELVQWTESQKKKILSYVQSPSTYNASHTPRSLPTVQKATPKQTWPAVDQLVPQNQMHTTHITLNDQTVVTENLSQEQGSSSASSILRNIRRPDYNHSAIQETNCNDSTNNDAFIAANVPNQVAQSAANFNSGQDSIAQSHSIIAKLLMPNKQASVDQNQQQNNDQPPFMGLSQHKMQKTVSNFNQVAFNGTINSQSVTALISGTTDRLPSKPTMAIKNCNCNICKMNQISQYGATYGMPNSYTQEVHTRYRRAHPYNPPGSDHSYNGQERSVSRDSGYLSPEANQTSLPAETPTDGLPQCRYPVIVNVTSMQPAKNVPQKRYTCNICQVCQKQTILQCLGCRLVYYCSRICHEKDWPVHRAFCSFLKRTI